MKPAAASSDTSRYGTWDAWVRLPDASLVWWMCLSLGLPWCLTFARQVGPSAAADIRWETRGAGDGGSGWTARLDLNQAGAGALELLPGVGPARASALVRERTAHGPYRGLEDAVRRVPSFTPELARSLETLLQVDRLDEPEARSAPARGEGPAPDGGIDQESAPALGGDRGSAG
jgi:hypothetical protein